MGRYYHYALDPLGNRYGTGVFYPLPGFYDIPVGVNLDSRWTDVVTVPVTAVELGVAFLIVNGGMASQLATPEFHLTLLGVLPGLPIG